MNAELKPIIDFHDQLQRLIDAELKINLGYENEPFFDVRKRCENSLTLRCGLGQPLEVAIQAAPELSSTHRDALLHWITTDYPSIVFDELTYDAQIASNFDKQLGVSLIQPIVLLLIAMVAFIMLCTHTLPAIAALYAQSEVDPSASLSRLMVIRDAMPIWAIAMPVLLLLFMFWWRRKSDVDRWRWFPGSSRYLQSMRYAAMADRVAELIDEGMTTKTALQTAAPDFSGESHLKAPLFQWAISGDVGDTPPRDVYRFVASGYRQAAFAQSSTIKAIFPVVLLSLLGGAIVFAFGFSLFLPFVELLMEIATSTRSSL